MNGGYHGDKEPSLLPCSSKRIKPVTRCGNTTCYTTDLIKGRRLNPEEVKVNLTPYEEIDILLNEWDNVKRLQEIRRQLNI